MDSQFGLYLREQREKKGIRLEEIASITKVHLKNLELLEKGDWDRLPPEPFIRGFILAYAKYVGLDTKEVLDRYVEETGRKAEKLTNLTESPVEIPSAKPVSERGEDRAQPTADPTEVLSRRKVFPIAQTVAGLVGVLLIGASLFLIHVGKHVGGETDQAVTPAQPKVALDIPAPSPATPQANEVELKEGESKIAEHQPKSPEKEPVREHHSESPAAGITLAAKTSPEGKAKSQALNDSASSAATKPAHELVVIGKERTWIKVVIDDAPPIEYFLNPGEKATYDAKEKIKIVLGNSTGAQVFHNGMPTPGVKYQGTIRSYIFPPDSHFPQDVVVKHTSKTEQAKASPSPSPSPEILQSNEKSDTAVR